MRKLMFVVNDAAFFLSHRLPIAEAARDEGFEVHVAVPPANGEVRRIEGAGFVYHPVDISRRGTRPDLEIAAVGELVELYREVAPDIVHHVTIKPVLYGGVAARVAEVPAVVSAVSGLGYVFIARGPQAAARRWAVCQFYRQALMHENCRVIFQNPDDEAAFRGEGLIRDGQGVLIRGSGADLSVFAPRPEVDGMPIVVLASRMLWDKGIAEFVRAAQFLRAQGVDARFVLVGDTDDGNPAAVPRTVLEEWDEQGHVEWWGYRNDIAEIFQSAHVVCLPSYREGLPKVLIEAAGCGRAIVTCDVPGCREVVRDGENGLLVPAEDAPALARAMRTLVLEPELRRRMGRRSREIAEADFSIETVVGQTLELYRELGGT
ncbi:MAG: glycosyltransferase family 4 protein [Bradymonadaceae bacterium]